MFLDNNLVTISTKRAFRNTDLKTQKFHAFPTERSNFIRDFQANLIYEQKFRQNRNDGIVYKETS